MQLAEIKNKLPRINLLYKYLTQNHKIFNNKGKILIKSQKLKI